MWVAVQDSLQKDGDNMAAAASAPPVHVLMVRLGHILEAMRLDLEAYASTGDREHLDHAHEGLMRALELRDQIERWL